MTVWSGQWKSLFNSSLVRQCTMGSHLPKHGLQTHEETDWSSFFPPNYCYLHFIRTCSSHWRVVIVFSQHQRYLMENHFLSQWLQATIGILKQQSTENFPQQPAFTVRCFCQQRAHAELYFSQAHKYLPKSMHSQSSVCFPSIWVWGQPSSLRCLYWEKKKNGRKLKFLHFLKSTQT